MTELNELLQLLLEETDMKSVSFCCDGSHMSFDDCTNVLNDNAALAKIDAALNKHYPTSFFYRGSSSRFFDVPESIRRQKSSWVKALREASESGKETFGELTIALRD